MATGVYKREEISIICFKCGKPFKAFSFHAKYCEKCKLEVKREKHRIYSRKKRAERRADKELKCGVCGCDLTKFKQSIKFCPECRNLAYFVRRKRYYFKNRDKINNRQKEYYKLPGNKERHRVIARESARRKRKRGI